VVTAKGRNGDLYVAFLCEPGAVVADKPVSPL
jgi:hypothetical protein